MESNLQDGSDKDLDRKLALWAVDAQPPRDLQSRVWARIAARPSWTETISGGIARVLESFARPAVAGIAAVVVLAFAIGAAKWQSSVAEQKAEAKLAARYLASIDPFQQQR